MSSLLDGLADLFVHEAAVAEQTFDGFGAGTPGTPFPVSCYIYGSVQRVTDRNGDMHDSRYVMVTNGHYGLTDRHLYTLPDQFFIRSGECIAVAEHTDDEDGPHHQTVYF